MKTLLAKILLGYNLKNLILSNANQLDKFVKS